jgi:hypothetical protein
MTVDILYHANKMRAPSVFCSSVVAPVHCQLIGEETGYGLGRRSRRRDEPHKSASRPLVDFGVLNANLIK